MDAHLKAGFAVVALVAAALVYFVACSASAAPYVLHFKNPGPWAYETLTTPWGIVAAPCAGGATCSVVVDIPVGRQTITAKAGAAGVLSPVSNALQALIAPAPADCLLLPACRFDADLDGTVSGTDFSAFVAAFGKTWVP